MVAMSPPLWFSLTLPPDSGGLTKVSQVTEHGLGHGRQVLGCLFGHAQFQRLISLSSQCVSHWDRQSAVQGLPGDAVLASEDLPRNATVTEDSDEKPLQLPLLMGDVLDEAQPEDGPIHRLSDRRCRGRKV